MIQRAAVSALLCLAVFARIASAHSIECDKPPVSSGTAPTLQQILDGLVVSGPPIDASAPINVELWTNSAAPMTAQLVVDYTPKSEGIKFGMYDPDNPGNHAFVLPGGIEPADLATVVFNANQSITVQGPISKTYSPFDGPFGFFVKVSDAKTEDGGHFDNGWHKGRWHKGGWQAGPWQKGGWHEDGGGSKGGGASEFFYTQDALNGGAARAVVFQGNGQTMIQLPGLAPGLFLPSQFLIAWETGLGDANDGEFNDFLVLVSNIVPATVPEPAFAFLLGISSLALIGARRARSALK